MIKLESEEFTILNLLKKAQQFSVPVYQRDYSWEKSHIEELLKDLNSIFKSNGKLEHFLGFIIATYNEKNPNLFNIIDGQQRLSTLGMMLSTLRDKFIELGDFDNSTFIQNDLLYPIDTENRRKRIPKFVLNMNDNELYFKLVIELPPEYFNRDKSKEEWLDFIKKRSIACEELCDKESEKKLSTVYSKINEFIDKKLHNLEELLDFEKEKKKEDNLRILNGLLDCVIKYFKIIFTSTSSMENAYAIFETLNDRGADLTLGDLLKNFILQKSQDEDTLDEAIKLWTNINDYIDPELITDFIRTYWLSAIEKVTSRNLFKDIKKFIDNEKRPLSAIDFLKLIENEIINYSCIINPSNFSKGKENELFNELSELNIKQCNPVILSVLASQKDKLADYLRLIIDFSFKFYTICKKNPRELEDFWSDKAIDIRENELDFKGFKKSILEYLPSDQDFKESFGNLSIKNNKLARYMLIKINEHLLRMSDDETIRNDPELIINRTITLEHILPKNMKKNSDWVKYYSKIISEDDNLTLHKIFVDRLGNMTLLSKEDNSSEKNDPFLKKRTCYESSKIPTTNMLKDYKNWTENSINKNQDYYSDIALEIWKV